MTGHLDKQIHRAQQSVYDLDYALDRRTQLREEFELLIATPMWKRLVAPTIWFVLGLGGLASAIIADVNGADPGWHFFYFLGGVIVLLAPIAAWERFRLKRSAPADAEHVKTSISLDERNLAEAEAHLESLRAKKQILIHDANWLNRKLTDLASVAGFTDDEITRMRGVLDATSSAILD